jgi:hypothetical protein
VDNRHYQPVDADEVVEYVVLFLRRVGLSDTYDVFEGCRRERVRDLRLGYQPGEWWQDVETDEIVWACRFASSNSNEVAVVVVPPERFGNRMPEPKVSQGLIGGKLVQHGEPPWDLYGGPSSPRRT